MNVRFQDYEYGESTEICGNFSKFSEIICISIVCVYIYIYIYIYFAHGLKALGFLYIYIYIYILSRVSNMTIDGVRIGIQIHWTLKTRNYNLPHSAVHCSTHLAFTVCCVFTSPLVPAFPSFWFPNCLRALRHNNSLLTAEMNSQ
jgi:hypothetical protein